MTTSTNLCISAAKAANTAMSNLLISTATNTLVDSLQNTLQTTTIPYDKMYTNWYWEGEKITDEDIRSRISKQECLDYSMGEKRIRLSFSGYGIDGLMYEMRVSFFDEPELITAECEYGYYEFIKEIRREIMKNSRRIDMGSGFDLSNFMVGFIEQPTVPKVKKVETYNGKVVKVIFEDGTFEKAVCDSGDTFNVDVGITICILKKMLGKDGHKKYNRLMKDIHKLMQKQVADKVAERQRKEAEKRKAERAKEKAMKRKEKAREEYIETHVEVMRRYNSEHLAKE